MTGFLFNNIDAHGQRLDYVLYVPRAYEDSGTARSREAWPLVLFLHGIGECGNDGQRMLINGLAPSIIRDAARWPCLVLMPQKPARERTWEHYEAPIMAAIERTERDYRVDPNRIAVTGLSQGGHGAWALAAMYPDRWSAVAPICGPLAPLTVDDIAPRVKDLPIWCFHGERDDIILAEDSRVIVAGIEALGGTPKLTLYPDIEHNSWDAAYAEEALPGWLLTNRRK